MGSRKKGCGPTLGAFAIVAIVVVLVYFGLPRMQTDSTADFNTKPYNMSVQEDPVTGEWLITAHVKPNRTLVKCVARCTIYDLDNAPQHTMIKDIGRVPGGKEQTLTFTVDMSELSFIPGQCRVSFSGTAVNIVSTILPSFVSHP